MEMRLSRVFPVLMGFATCFASFLPEVSAQTTSSAQTAPIEAQCILAGRISGFGRWGPRLLHLELLDDKAQQVLDESSEALASVRQVRVNAPTLLVVCNRDKPGAMSAVGETVPAISSGPQALNVKGLSLVPVGIGGHWVELELLPEPARVIRVPAQAN